MKHISLFIALLATHVCVAMENDELTQTEKDCYNWFKELQKTVPSPFQALSPEDRKTFETQVKFQDDPEAVTQSRNNFAEAFFANAQKAGKELAYNKELLKATFIKMTKMMHGQTIKKPTDLLTARMYVFSLLSPEEKITYSQGNYCKDPEATKVVIRKWSNLVCDELIKLNLLENSVKAREEREKELFDEVVARFEHTYKSTKDDKDSDQELDNCAQILSELKMK